jgi:hypothetical protein
MTLQKLRGPVAASSCLRGLVAAIVILLAILQVFSNELSRSSITNANVVWMDPCGPSTTKNAKQLVMWTNKKNSKHSLKLSTLKLLVTTERVTVDISSDKTINIPTLTLLVITERVTIDIGNDKTMITIPTLTLLIITERVTVDISNYLKKKRMILNKKTIKKMQKEKHCTRFHYIFTLHCVTDIFELTAILDRPLRCNEVLLQEKLTFALKTPIHVSRKREGVIFENHG